MTMNATVAEVLAKHRVDHKYDTALHEQCICGRRWMMGHRAFESHQAAALSAAGFGLLPKAEPPEVRHSTLTSGETELDEVVARNASVHLEAMDDNHWWLLVESGGKAVHVNFYTKRAKIRGHAEVEDS